MNRSPPDIFNLAVIILILAIVFFSWFYMRDQFMWGVLLIIIILLFAGYINIVRKMPGNGLTPLDTGVAIGAFFILAFAWFYMREQFCWAGNFVILLLAIALGMKLMKWFRDVVSIQVIVHKKEDDDGKDKK